MLKNNFRASSVFFLLLLLFYSCDEKFKPAQTGINPDDSPTQESWNSEIVFSDSGIVKAILTAGHISVFSKKGYTLIDSGAKVDFFRNNVKISTLTGRKGKIDDRTKNIEVYDSVTAVNSEGSELKTQKLLWNNKTQKVSSDEFVKIKTPAETIEGVGFESDSNLKNYKIYKVSGTFSN